MKWLYGSKTGTWRAIQCLRIRVSALESIAGERKVSNVTHIWVVSDVIIRSIRANMFSFNTNSCTLCLELIKKRSEAKYCIEHRIRKRFWNLTLNFHNVLFSIHSISVHTPLQNNTILPIHEIGGGTCILIRICSWQYCQNERKPNTFIGRDVTPYPYIIKCYTLAYTHQQHIENINGEKRKISPLSAHALPHINEEIKWMTL